MHCKLPSTKIPNRSHKTSASSMECAENTKARINRKLMRFKLSLCCYLTCAELPVGRDHIQPGGKKKKIYFIYDTYGERERERERERVLVRMIARSCFARFTTFHKLFLEAGSKPVLGSSI
jgi:hypothetical protein